MTENEKSMSELWKDFKQPIISVTGVPQKGTGDQKANKQKHQTKQNQNKTITKTLEKNNPKFLNLMKRINPNIKETQQI